MYIADLQYNNTNSPEPKVIAQSTHVQRTPCNLLSAPDFDSNEKTAVSLLPQSEFDAFSEFPFAVEVMRIIYIYSTSAVSKSIQLLIP
jgi:hypothetical protein